MTLAIDTSTPPLVALAATSVTTASFTPPVGSLLVLQVMSTSFSGTPTFTVTSSGLTFATAGPFNNVAGQSVIQMYTCDVGASGGSARTVNATTNAYASIGLKVWVVTGQHATLYVDTTNTSNTTANAFNGTITTGQDGCWVFGGGAEFQDVGISSSTDVAENIFGVDIAYTAARKANETTKAGPELVNFDAVGTATSAWAWNLISIRPASFTPPAIGKKADRGQVANTTTATSTAVAMAAAGSISTGNYLIARIALDNAGTSGAAPTCTITDPRSNTWTVVGPANRTAASAANDGSTTYIAYAKVVNTYTNGDSLTVNHSPTTPAKAINVEEWYGIDGTTPVAVASTTATGSSATPSIARTPLAAGQLFYGAISAEGPATDVFTQDTDTTDGNWVTLTRVASANATAASNQDVYGVAKLVTGTSVQTWNPNIGTSRDWAQLALVFAPTGGSFNGSASLTGTATIAASGTVSSGASVAATATVSASASVVWTGGSTPTAAANVTATGSTVASTGASLVATAGLLTTGAATASSTLNAVATIAAAGLTSGANSAALAVSSAVTATGVASGTAVLPVTATVAAVGNVATSSSASVPITATVAASSGGGTSSGSTLAVTAAVIATGNLAVTGSASVSALATSAATGAVDKSTSATLTVTAATTAAGVASYQGQSSLTITSTITASPAGAGLSGGSTTTITATVTASGLVSGAAVRTVTATVTAAGNVGSPAFNGSAAPTVTVSVTASGVVGKSSAATVPVTVTLSATGAANLQRTAALLVTTLIAAAGVNNSTQLGVAHAATGPVPTARPVIVPTAGSAGSQMATPSASRGAMPVPNATGG